MTTIESDDTIEVDDTIEDLGHGARMEQGAKPMGPTTPTGLTGTQIIILISNASYIT